MTTLRRTLFAVAALLVLSSWSVPAQSACGTFVTKWGSFGSGNGQFNDPNGVAVDGSGNVYVADSNNNRIQKFSCSGGC